MCYVEIVSGGSDGRSNRYVLKGVRQVDGGVRQADGGIRQADCNNNTINKTINKSAKAEKKAENRLRANAP